MAGSVAENVTKQSFASERMQAAERAHNFVVDFSAAMQPIRPNYQNQPQ